MSYQSLYIGYANVKCTTEQIKQEFDAYLQANIVSKVDERIKTDMKGHLYKIFFIHFDFVNSRLTKLFENVSAYQIYKVKRWNVKFNTRLRDTKITYESLEREDYWENLAKEFKPKIETHVV